MAPVAAYWGWLGRRLRLSRPGRVLFTLALLVCGAAFSDAWAHGAREGGAPLVVLALVLLGVVGGDAVGRRVVAMKPRRRQ